MSIENINQAAGAMNTLTARMNNFVNDADAQIALRQAAYDALAGNLVGVVRDQMRFTGTIDPDEANPTLVNGGTFTTIAQFVSRAPSGCDARAGLLAGKTYPITTLYLYGHSIEFFKVGVVESTDDPIIAPTAVLQGGTLNYVNSFAQRGNGRLRFTYVNVQMPEKVDEGLPWSASNQSLVSAWRCTSADVEFLNSTFKGPDGTCILSASNTNHCKLSLSQSTLDGLVFGVSNNAGGTTLIAKNGVTMLNGAEYHQTGSLGTTLLMN
jgi:hypothetical protein